MEVWLPSPRTFPSNFQCGPWAAWDKGNPVYANARPLIAPADLPASWEAGAVQSGSSGSGGNIEGRYQDSLSAFMCAIMHAGRAAVHCLLSNQCLLSGADAAGLGSTPVKR